jgi:hypothetical protein
LLASQHPAFGSFLIETPRIFRQIGTPFGRSFIHLKYLHFSSGWPTNFGFKICGARGA